MHIQRYIAEADGKANKLEEQLQQVERKMNDIPAELFYKDEAGIGLGTQKATLEARLKTVQFEMNKLGYVIMKDDEEGMKLVEERAKISSELKEAQNLCRIIARYFSTAVCVTHSF